MRALAASARCQSRCARAPARSLTSCRTSSGSTVSATRPPHLPDPVEVEPEHEVGVQDQPALLVDGRSSAAPLGRPPAPSAGRGRRRLPRRTAVECARPRRTADAAGSRCPIVSGNGAASAEPWPPACRRRADGRSPAGRPPAPAAPPTGPRWRRAQRAQPGPQGLEAGGRARSDSSE